MLQHSYHHRFILQSFSENDFHCWFIMHAGGEIGEIITMDLCHQLMVLLMIIKEAY
jgi:hypothetical protein